MKRTTKKSKKPINKSTGCKLNRSEIVQVRFTPKLRYALEILAKNENRTVSSAIETLVSEGIKNHYALLNTERDDDNKEISIAEAVEQVWDADEAVRFVKTAFKMPQILSHEEEKVWHFIKRTNYYWIFIEGVRREYVNEDGEVRCYVDVFRKYEINSLHWEHFLADWDLLKIGDIDAVKRRYMDNDLLTDYGKFIPLDYNPILEPEKIEYFRD